METGTLEEFRVKALPFVFKSDGKDLHMVSLPGYKVLIKRGDTYSLYQSGMRYTAINLYHDGFEEGWEEEDGSTYVFGNSENVQYVEPSKFYQIFEPFVIQKAYEFGNPKPINALSFDGFAEICKIIKKGKCNLFVLGNDYIAELPAQYVVLHAEEGVAVIQKGCDFPKSYIFYANGHINSCLWTSVYSKNMNMVSNNALRTILGHAAVPALKEAFEFTLTGVAKPFSSINRDDLENIFPDYATEYFVDIFIPNAHNDD